MLLLKIYIAGVITSIFIAIIYDGFIKKDLITVKSILEYIAISVASWFTVAIGIYCILVHVFKGNLFKKLLEIKLIDRRSKEEIKSNLSKEETDFTGYIERRKRINKSLLSISTERLGSK